MFADDICVRTKKEQKVLPAEELKVIFLLTRSLSHTASASAWAHDLSDLSLTI